MIMRGKFRLGAGNSPLPPEGVYAETSFWLRLYHGDEWAAEVEAFLRYAARRNVPIVTSNHALRELKHVIRRQVFGNYAISLGRTYPDGSGNWTWFEKKADRALVKSANQDLSRAYVTATNRIYNDPGIIVPAFDDNQQLQVAADAIGDKYMLDTNDALHVAIMRSWGLNSIASTDGDYLPLENTNVYTVRPFLPGLILPKLLPFVREPWEDHPETDESASSE